MTAHLKGSTATGLTLNDLLERARTDMSVSLKQRRELTSAITSTCKWLNRTPAEVPADHNALRIAFGALTPAGVGVSVGRFANVRSMLKRVLEEAGIPMLERRDRPALSAAWQTLVDGIENGYARAAILRFVRFLSAGGISPEAVDDSAAAAYQARLASSDFSASPWKVTQAAVRTWNRLVDRGWPVTRLTPLVKFQRYTLTWDQLPTSLVAEIDGWEAICAGRDLLDPRTPPRPLAPESLKSRRRLILELISGLHHQGFDVHRLSGLADLCVPQRVKLSLRYHVQRHRNRTGEHAGEVRTPTVGGIADLARQIAKYHIDAPPETVAELTDLARRFRPAPGAMSETAERRLAQIEDECRLRVLLRHPILEMRKLATKPSPHRLDAVRYSVLLAIAVLCIGPLRLKNLAALDLDQHLRLPGNRRGQVLITIPSRSVKNAKPIKFAIPPRLVNSLRVYLERFRPLLLRAASSALFPGRGGRDKERKLLGRQISGLLRREIGLEWHPHLFRHMTAFVFNHYGSGGHGDTQLVLRHVNADTTRRIYEGFDARPAFGRYDQLIDGLTGTLPTTLRRTKRKNPADSDMRKG